MAAVPLVFNLPAEEDLIAMNIYEAPSADGPWTQIDSVSEIGTYPDYINEYVTQAAISEDDWFAISTVDQANVESDLSVPMQGGTNTVVNMVAERVLQRGIMLDESIVIQETEAAVEQYFGVDPYTVDPDTVSYSQLTGLTYLVLARTFVVSQIQTNSISGGGAMDSWVAGLVSMKSGSSSASSQSSEVSFDWLMDQASKMLGIGTSRIAQMVLPDEDRIACGTARIISLDISRLEVMAIE